MNRIVVFFYTFFNARKPLFYSILVAIFVVLAFFASRISFQEDITKMIPDDESTEGYKSAIKNVRILDKIIVSFRADTIGMEDSLIACANKFVAQIKADSVSNSLVSEIRYRIDEERLADIYDLTYTNLPLYLVPEDYKRIDSLTTEAGVKESVERGYHKLISPASFVLKQFVLKDPLSLSTPALEKLQAMQADDSYELHDGYIFKKDKKTLMVFLSPMYASNNTSINAPLIDGIDAGVKNIEDTSDKIDVSYFGATAVAVANARQIERDIKVIASIAMLIVLAFLYFFYRSWSLPLLMISPIVFGGLFSLSIIYLLQGTMSAIAIGAGSVVIGIALDYSFHVFAHYQHTRDIKTVVRDIAVPMMIGSVSTVGAFFSLLYVHSDILCDFGLFAGLCLIGASLFSLFFLPHLIESFVSEKDGGNSLSETKMSSLVLKLAALKPEKSKWLVGLISILTLVFVYYSNRVTFDSDLSQINYMPTELKAAEDALYDNDTAKGKIVFFIFNGKDISEALYKNERAVETIDLLKEDNEINRYSGVSGLLPSDSVQNKRIEYWNAYWTPQKIAQVKEYVTKYSVELGFKPEAFNSFFESLDKQYVLMSDNDRLFLKDVFLKDYIQTDSSGVTVLASMRVPTSMSDDVYNAFDSIEGLTILDRQLFYNKFSSIVKNDFDQILFSSSLFVFLILLISYGRMELSLISFIPMLISWFWILGLMGIFDIHFNIVNIIISTFVFGLGDDYSIFITDGLQKKYSEGKDNLPSYKVSVFLSAFTTIIAMGALIFAKHPALKSIAIISIIGIVCVFIISYTLIPMLFKWFITDRTEKGKQPLTLAILCRTFIYALLAFVLVIDARIRRRMFAIFAPMLSATFDRKLYKWFFSISVKLFVACCFFMKRKKQHVDLNVTSTVIITNEQSVLGMLLLLSLNSRVVLLENDCTTKSYLSRLVLYLQDLKAAKGLANAACVKELIADGYIPVLICKSDAVANQLDLILNKIDTAIAVIPLLIVGTENCLAKNDYVLSRGLVFINQYPKQLYSNAEAGKILQTFVSIELNTMLSTMPMSVHFNKILSSYIYKGPVLEWYYRIKVQLEKSYQDFNDLLPTNGKIYDLGCGYGFLDYFLMLQSQGRTIIGVDYDSEKIIVAQKSYLKNDRLTFKDGDVMQVQVENADAVLILDVLHYLSVENQCNLIRSSFEGLNKGGILIIRDGDASQVEKHKGTKLTEFFSTKLLMFNKQTEKELCFITSEMIIDTLNAFDVDVKVLDTTVYTSNIIHYVIKK